LVQIGRFFTGQGLLMQAIFLVLAVALVWLLIRPFKKLHPYTGQILVLGGIFWIGLVFYFITFALPVPRIAENFNIPSTIPRFWFFLLVPVIILALIPMLKGEEDSDLKSGNLKRLSAVFGTLVISLILFQYIGYYISSAIFLFVVIWVLGSRSKIELIAIPVGWVIFSYLFFARLLFVRLPVGELFTRLFG